MKESQKAEPFETPERSTIRGTTKSHVSAMEQSNADAVWILSGMRHLLLRTVGRRSGEERKAALPFWRDENDHPIVVASYAGAPGHPSWYLNLEDRGANPQVTVRIQDHEYQSEPEILESDEYASVWNELVADRPFYVDYQALTERRIPLVRLREIRST
jgi:deazaflavin-dependent oxidoreductase (nitroreductase family)